jgi:hypothetical protein
VKEIPVQGQNELVAAASSVGLIAGRCRGHAGAIRRFPDSLYETAQEVVRIFFSQLVWEFSSE